MDLALKTRFCVKCGKTAASGSEMRMVVHTEEYVSHDIFRADCSEKSSHLIKPPFCIVKLLHM